MKKTLLVTALFVFAVSQVFAADFAPTPMAISAPAAVYYGFDGSELGIDMGVSGTPANAQLLVYTKDMSASIAGVTNGYLGYHYVNKIDTCVYAGEAANYDMGNHTITWDGKDNDGNAVESGDYTYYIWGFDNVNFKIQLTRSLHPRPWGRITIVTKDNDGSTLSAPVAYQGSGARAGSGTDLISEVNVKWIVGSDPLDDSLAETSECFGYGDAGKIGFDPTNRHKYFKAGLNNNGSYVTKAWVWVPNGESEINADWGDEGEASFGVLHSPGWEFGPGILSNGGDYLISANGDLGGTSTEAELIFYDVNDGSEVQRLDVAAWYVSIDDGENGGQSSSGPATLASWGNTMLTGAHSTCMNLLFDTLYDDEDEAVLWSNDNGDYTGDHNFEEDSERPWMCNDYNVGPYKYSLSLDDMGFSVFTSFDMGAVSFGQYAPDGTGLGYKALSGETAGQKFDTEFLSSGTAYDGMMVSNQSGEDATGYWWVGQDCFQGVITSGVGVDEDASAFSVGQNAPNPFNPTTTISFETTEAGNVTIDVFNVAGQKVGTIANEFMNAGSHSSTWNATGFSAGVYFYTVKSGDFSKTMKMTLLK